MSTSSSALSLLAASTTRGLAGNNRRLILTRWLAGVVVLLATAFTVHGLRLPLPEAPLYLVGGFILAYNAVLAWLTRRAYTPDDVAYGQRIQRLVLWQIGLDWLSMWVFMHLTGGIASPGITFFFIHVVMVTVLLPGQSPYIYAGIAVLGVVLIAMLEGAGILPRYSPLPGVACELCANPMYAVAQILFLAVGLFATAYITASIIQRLRLRERQISALLQTAEDVNATLELGDTLERLAINAALALSVSGASIRLLDSSGETLQMAASYGLSRVYLEKGPVALSASQVDREALTGQAVIVHDPQRDPRVQYPAEMAAEGIQSVLAVPILGRRRPLGVLRVYSREANRFDREDADFITAIAQQGAIAIENALAHDALQRADHERAQFVRTVTHELRAPVTGAQSLVSLLSRNIVGELTPEQRDIVSRLEKRFDLLLALIGDLLAFAASKAVDLKQPLVPVPLTTTLQQVVERLAPQAQHKGLDFSLTLPPEPLTVQATEEGLARIFENLIGNAVKYTPEGGKVLVSAWREGPSVHVSVADTGIGIPAEDIEKLGQEFFRAANAREANITGTGLGMTIVKQLLGTFGGLLSVQSVVGQGSTFTVTLPLAAASDQPSL
ncbi:MAG: GAF domain-containing sensor histidine kinase [Anaerolineae bacterium]|nr:GAF domain-containing sensor histidine kinase [Anaerolineae bacterium]